MTTAATLPVESEKDFASWFEDALRLYGWRFHHCETSWSRGRFRTAISGNPGFPDYVCARGIQLFLAELKSRTGNLSAEQRSWHSVLAASRAIKVYIWRPYDRDQILELLKGDS